MGLVIIGALALYLLLAIAVVIGAVKYAKKTGKSAKRWGWSAVLVMYLIPFWDWIPTVAVHQYYCSKEAGFWVYKSLDQWKTENPGVMETLVARTTATSNPTEKIDENNWRSSYILNDRFEKSFEHRGPLLMYRWKTEITLVDKKSNEVIARSVDFYTAHERAGGGWRGWKFWLSMEHCPDYVSESKNFAEYLAKFKGIIK